MKVINKYIYPTSTRAEIEGLRHYTVDGEEKPLPSVTPILGKTQPKDKQASLARWRERIGTREAEKLQETQRSVARRCINTLKI